MGDIINEGVYHKILEETNMNQEIDLLQGQINQLAFAFGKLTQTVCEQTKILGVVIEALQKNRKYIDSELVELWNIIDPDHFACHYDEEPAYYEIDPNDLLSKAERILRGEDVD